MNYLYKILMAGGLTSDKNHKNKQTKNPQTTESVANNWKTYLCM